MSNNTFNISIGKRNSGPLPLRKEVSILSAWDITNNVNNVHVGYLQDGINITPLPEKTFEISYITTEPGE